MKSKVNIIYVQYSKAVKGNWIRVATNKRIPVTVGESKSTMDLGGYYVIHASDLKTIMEELKRREKIKVKMNINF